MKVRPRSGLTVLLLACLASIVHLSGAESLTNEAGSSYPPSGNMLEMFFQLLGALLIVIALLIGGAWFFRKTRYYSLYQGGPAQLRILESRSLGYRNTLLVVGYGPRRFLLSASTAGVQLLSSLPDAPDSPPANRPSFAEELSSLQEKKA